MCTSVEYSRRSANSRNGERLDGSSLEVVLATAQLHRKVVTLVPHTIHLGSRNDERRTQIGEGGVAGDVICCLH